MNFYESAHSHYQANPAKLPCAEVDCGLRGVGAGAAAATAWVLDEHGGAASRGCP